MTRSVRSPAPIPSAISISSTPKTLPALRRLVDADVLIGALDSSDAHHSRARHLLTEWRQRQDAVAISAVNLTEVLVAPAADPSTLAKAREAIAALELESHLPNDAIAVVAA